MGLKFYRQIKGFTLVEVIISIGILAVGIVAVLRVFAFCAKTTGVAGDTISAVFLAQDLFQGLEFKEGRGEIASGEESGSRGKFRWNYSLGHEAGLNLSKLELEIGWDRAGRQERIDLHTYLLAR